MQLAKLNPWLVIVLLYWSGPASAQPSPAPDPAPLFSRHVLALFSKLGCNGGACHGAVQGQNGFKLSLFGAEPALDHQRLLREAGGRRLNLIQPDHSLLLQKGAGLISHQSGQRFQTGGPEHALLKRWLENGATLDNLERSRLVKLQVSPAQRTAQPK